MRNGGIRTFLAAAVLVAAAPCAEADAPRLPVVIFSVGPGAMRLRAAAGVVAPCTSASNTPLFEGTIAPGQQVILGTAENCVCVEHTYGNFPDADWSVAQIACHHMSCVGRSCRPNPDPAIRIVVSSNGP